MSHFTNLRQRIRVIQTIHKTTGAMRLIAMSLQGRLRRREQIFTRYADAIKRVHDQQLLLEPELTDTAADGSHQEKEAGFRQLTLLVGSHKGLCGAFNQHMFEFFKKQHAWLPAEKIITVGTQATTWLKQQGRSPCREFNALSSTTFVQIAHQLTEFLIASGYTHVVVFSHIPRTFFIQQPTMVTIPVPSLKGSSLTPHSSLRPYLDRLMLQSSLLKVLYDSLLAEQAARFLSMDNATRSAEKLLSETKLEYNKVRQARVTRELIELTSSYRV